MAMIPTMMASTPTRISEVDDDLSTDVGRGVDVDVDMTGCSFRWVRVPFRLSWVRGRGCQSSGTGIGHRSGRHQPVLLGWPARESMSAGEPVMQASWWMPLDPGGQHYGAGSDDQAVVHRCQPGIDPGTGQKAWRPARTVGAGPGSQKVAAGGRPKPAIGWGSWGDERAAAPSCPGASCG